jgi:hypothetical protein
MTLSTLFCKLMTMAMMDSKARLQAVLTTGINPSSKIY